MENIEELPATGTYKKYITTPVNTLNIKETPLCHPEIRFYCMPSKVHLLFWSKL